MTIDAVVGLRGLLRQRITLTGPAGSQARADPLGSRRADVVAALRDGWRLLQMSQLQPHSRGDEFTTAYLKYEFLFEQLVDLSESSVGEG